MEFIGKLLLASRKNFGQNEPWIVYRKGPQNIIFLDQKEVQ